MSHTNQEALSITDLTTIRDEFKLRIPPDVNFTWGPLGIDWAELPGFPWEEDEPIIGAPEQDEVKLTPALSEISFEADVRIPEGDFIISYAWDFGDGSKGYGPNVVHTYVAPSPSTRTVLCVTDNRGRRFCRGKQMNLRPAQLTMIYPAIQG